MNNSHEDKQYSRRQALYVLGSAVGSSALMLSACKSESKTPEKPAAAAKKPAAAAGGDQCDSVAPIDATSAQLRKSLQYKAKSDKPGKNCANCAQWEGDKFEGPCGGCKLFTGAVNPEGNCLSHAPKAPA